MQILNRHIAVGRINDPLGDKGFGHPAPSAVTPDSLAGHANGATKIVRGAAGGLKPVIEFHGPDTTILAGDLSTTMVVVQPANLDMHS